MAEQPSNGLPSRVWKWVSEAANAATIFGSSGFSAAVAWLLPFNWATPLPWLITLTAFSGMWLVIRGAMSGFDFLRRWRTPSTISITANGGEHGVLTIHHTGYPTNISAEGRIVEVVGDHLNPSPHLFECKLSRGQQTWSSVKLRDGEWAHIVVSGMPMPQYADERVHAIFRGGTYVQIPASGAVIEITVKSRPKIDAGAVTERFRATWERGLARLEKLPSREIFEEYS